MIFFYELKHLSLPHPAVPNIAAALDVMHHTVLEKMTHISVIIDTGDETIRLTTL